MQALLVDFITSLDGYGAAEGWPGWWGLEGSEYLAWLGQQPERDYTILIGANSPGPDQAGLRGGIGSLNHTISPSPANHPTVASKRMMSWPIAVWNSRITPMTSSGSVVELNAVHPRRSANNTAISRRWLSRICSPSDRTSS